MPPSNHPNRAPNRRQPAHLRDIALAAVLAAHAAAGLLMYRVPMFATLHAWVTILAAGGIAAVARRSAPLLIAAAYVTGCEVLWRMSKAALFYESAKYVLCAMFLVGLIRLRCVRIALTPSLYFALLVPSVMTAYFLVPFDTFRQGVSFNLSGPLAIALAVLFCANARVKSREALRVALAFAAPAAGIAAITLFTTYTRTVVFTTESNFATSGGFGPNQVSAALGLAALLVLCYLLHQRVSKLRRMLLLAVLLVSAAQSAMTFSRSGIVAAALSALVVAPQIVRRRKMRLALAGVTAVTMLAIAVVYPRLERFTGGRLSQRFSETELTGREELVRRDLELWRGAPVFGIGAGISRFAHGRFSAAHTEYSRVLAEHGVLGLASLGLLLGMAARPFFATPRRHRDIKPLLCALAVWMLCYAAVNAMRTAAAPFALGLASLGGAVRYATPVSAANR